MNPDTTSDQRKDKLASLLTERMGELLAEHVSRHQQAELELLVDFAGGAALALLHQALPVYLAERLTDLDETIDQACQTYPANLFPEDRYVWSAGVEYARQHIQDAIARERTIKEQN